MQFILLTYDIRDDRRLRRVMQVAESYGVRLQKSVFECWLSDDQLGDLIDELKKVINRRADAVRLYRMCAACRSLRCSHGETRMLGDLDVLVW